MDNTIHRPAVDVAPGRAAGTCARPCAAIGPRLDPRLDLPSGGLWIGLPLE